MSPSNGTVFRIEKNSNYTVMSNHHLQNTALSLKAKGLLSLMLSLPDNWDYSMNGLVAICEDGLASVKSGIKELENHGYIQREQKRNANGQMGRMSYVVSELPMPVKVTDKGLPPKVEKPLAVKPSMDKPLAENPLQSSTKELNKQESNTNQSFFQENDNSFENWKERIEETEKHIKEQIEYNILQECFSQEQVDELFELILEVYLHSEEYLYIGKERKATSLVKRRFTMLDFECIESILDGLESNTTKILDMKAYLLACLYNAPATKNNKVSSQVNHDLSKPSASYDLEALDWMITEGSVWD